MGLAHRLRRSFTWSLGIYGISYFGKDSSSFFNEKNVIYLFDNAGLGVEIVTHKEFGPKTKLIHGLSLGLREYFLLKQYFVKARKN
jgi:hypothetical protein